MNKRRWTMVQRVHIPELHAEKVLENDNISFPTLQTLFFVDMETFPDTENLIWYEK